MEKRKIMDINIGINMSKLRKKFNLTQKEICTLVGVNESTYKHYELGDRMVPISILQDLAKIYKISINYFFENTTELSNKELIKLFYYPLKESTNNTNNNISNNLVEKENKVQTKIRIRIKKLRQENNKSQKEIAEYLDIDLSTYNKYEKGNRKLSNEVIKKIAEYYNISISKIVD